MKKIIWPALLLCLMLPLHAPLAATDNTVPRELSAWTDWVLRKTPNLSCPILYNANTHFCAFPSSLKFRLASNGGSFTQQWQVHKTSWVNLPGGTEHWPLMVMVNQKPAVVVNHKGRPGIELEAGLHQVEGKFVWSSMPNSIPVPDESGLVYLVLNNNTIEMPDLRNGQLWLKDTSAIPKEDNRLDIQVFRKITDSIPMYVTTSIVLDISGQQREIQLQGSVLQNFRPAAINSQLPARIDAQGVLHIQVRPGRWTVEISTLHLASLEQLPLQTYEKPWPENEVWVFEHQSHIRMVRINGKQSIDPAQTQLPEAWKNMPAYLMAQGDALNLDIIKRGNPDPEPDQLTLRRVMWLDFAGTGMTVQDTISGSLSQHWRLNALPELQLGQVTLDGQPQFITRLPDQQQQGVEVRQGNVNLQADSRIVDTVSSLSATGWDSAFNKVSAELNLPAGYRLIHVSGARAPDSWFNRWTLMDLFMVLITSMAVYRLWGKQWSVLALFTLALTWHEVDAPQYIWLNLIITIALLRTLPQGRLQRWLVHYRNITALLLAIFLLDFSVTHVRLALYPQLERPGIVQPFNRDNNYIQQAESAGDTAFEEAAEEFDEVQDSERVAMTEQIMSAPMKSYSSRTKDISYAQSPAFEYQMQVDPNALIQTGPGLPGWQWQRYRLDWDGPVSQSQRLGLVYLTPVLYRVFHILVIALMLLLAWRLFDYKAFRSSLNAVKQATSVTGMILIVSVMLSVMPSPATAEYPPADMLNDLHEYLVKPEECLPDCASIESLHAKINASTLKLTLRVHAQEDVAVPLPFPIDKWTPSQITVDAKPAQGLFRRQDQYLWLRLLPGTHRVVIEGRVTHLSQLKIDFLLKPHAIEVNASGWSADGLDQSVNAISAINFTRTASGQSGKQSKNASSDLPVFAQVTRRLDMALDWSVETTVALQSGTALPAILRIPLLSGESVISEGIKTEKGYAVITLNDNRRQINWRSTLARVPQLTLNAADTEQFREIWQLNASPVWHVSYEGIPVIYHQRDGQYWQPQWQPLPKETVTLNIVRPEGVAGNTLTIDRSYLLLTPGENITDAELQLSMRSSLGGQHEIRLPDAAELLSVEINNNNIPVRITSGVLALPVSPGPHHVVIKWREPRGAGFGRFTSSQVDLGVSHVNTSIGIKPGQQRWVLLVGGPLLGPAVLFWGVLGVIVLAAAGLSRVQDMPLSLAHWVLLGIGLSTTSPAATILVAGWLFALRWRSTADMDMSAGKFNAIQVALVVLTLMAMSTLLFAVQQGLLGSPDMQIAGNQSSSYMLNWFSDRSESQLPAAWMITLPVWVYRMLMLLWSIWLAFALIKWLRWAWISYTASGYWRSKPARTVAPSTDEK